MSSQEEIFGVLQSLYRDINGKNVALHQKHELMLLCGKSFEKVARKIVEEIALFEGTDPDEDLAVFGKRRGFCSTVADRDRFLYELLSDLQTERLAAERVLAFFVCGCHNIVIRFNLCL